jgi:hypothetical protein
MSWLKWAAVAASIVVAYKVGVKVGQTNRLKLDAKKVLNTLTGQPDPEEG